MSRRSMWCVVQMSLLVAFLASVAILAGPALAQDRGAIAGTVTDASGAVIPGVKIRIVQVGTNASWSIEGNDAGLYYAPNLPLGSYTVTAQKEGFRTATSAAVEIRSQANVRVDIKLEVGALDGGSLKAGDRVVVGVEAAKGDGGSKEDDAKPSPEPTTEAKG